MRPPADFSVALPARSAAEAANTFALLDPLRRVFSGAPFQAEDAVDTFTLVGEHYSVRLVARAAQAPSDRQAVFAGQHQVQHQ